MRILAHDETHDATTRSNIGKRRRGESPRLISLAEEDRAEDATHVPMDAISFVRLRQHSCSVTVSNIAVLQQGWRNLCYSSKILLPGVPFLLPGRRQNV